MYHERTNYIDINYHFIHKTIYDGKVSVQKNKTWDNPIDIFTKPLLVGKFKLYLDVIAIYKEWSFPYGLLQRWWSIHLLSATIRPRWRFVRWSYHLAIFSGVYFICIGIFLFHNLGAKERIWLEENNISSCGKLGAYILFFSKRRSIDCSFVTHTNLRAFHSLVFFLLIYLLRVFYEKVECWETLVLTLSLE